MKTNYFILGYPGHGGGDWMTLLCNNHPAKMSVVLEPNKEEMLDFEARGLDRKKDMDPELLRFFNFRDGKDACVGVLKCEHSALWKWMKPRGGRCLRLMRNPITLIGTRMWRKVPDATRYIQKLYNHKPENDDEMFEGHVMRYAYMFYERYLRQAAKDAHRPWPLVRLEDLNQSVGTDGKYFIRVMEWLTQTPWSQQYVKVIRHEYTPAHAAYTRVVFDADYNVERVLAWPRIRWRGRFRTPSEWGEDVSPGSASRYWGNWSEEWRIRYLKHMGMLQARLGYNQDHIGSTDPDWEFRGVYGEVG